jgi:hypothetical protein
MISLRVPDPLEPLRAAPSSVEPQWLLWLIVGAILVCGALQIVAAGAALLGFLR